MNTIYFEKSYCDECGVIHWLEIARNGQPTCRGESYTPHSDTNHYTRRLGHGIEVIETKPQPALPLEWVMLADARQPVEVDF